MRYLAPRDPGRRLGTPLQHRLPVVRSLRAVHAEVLERVASGDELPGIMDLLCRRMVERSPQMVCSVLRAGDDRHLHPVAMRRAQGKIDLHLHPVEISPLSGSCGAAAFLRRPVGSLDIATDPRWFSLAEPALAAGLHASWSSPIIAHDGRLLGTFALYFREHRGPSERERRLVDRCLDVCRLAIGHDRLLRALRETNDRFSIALGNMSQGVCFFDGEQRLIVANRRYCELYDLSPATVTPGTSLADVVARRVEAGSGPKMRTDPYLVWRASVNAAVAPSDTEVELENGRTISIHHQPMAGGGWVATHEDVTERRRAEEQIAHMARHDALTGLPNRRTFSERLDRALAYVARGQGCAVLCLDLDNFKHINDTLGHPAGDALLRGVTERLLSCVREVDTVTRLGGDEFAVLLVGLDGPDRAAEVSERIGTALRTHFVLEGQELIISCSIGIAVAMQDGATPAQLLTSADLAMYRAKSEARGGYSFFEPGMDARRQARVALERDLRAAITAQSMTLAFQPLLDTATREITGFEALLRWHHPVRGEVTPAEFIPVAEETGMIVELGDWVLRRACAEAASWPRPVKVAVNVAAAQFRHDGLFKSVALALEESGLTPARLELEVTETVLLKGGAVVIEALQRVKALGVNVALDDFGTGSSSLHYLRRFPFARIKIDRSFVQELSELAEGSTIVRAIVGLGRSLAMTTTAEGVETEHQFARLLNEGCGEVQGFLFSAAVPGAEARAMLEGVGLTGAVP